MQGPGADWGSLKCGCHPNCGIGTAFMVSKKTNAWAPVASFIDVERMMQDARQIADAARGPRLTKLQTALSLLRNYRPTRKPKGFRLIDLLKKYDKQSGGQLGGIGAPRTTEPERRRMAGALRRRHVVPGSVDLRFPPHRDVHHPVRHAGGEISFCAYNTGVGWRQIVEKMHKNATVAEWYKAHGKHAVYANPRKEVPLPVDAQPVALKIPRDGRLVEWEPQPKPKPDLPPFRRSTPADNATPAS